MCLGTASDEAMLVFAHFDNKTGVLGSEGRRVLAPSRSRSTFLMPERFLLFVPLTISVICLNPFSTLHSLPF